MGRLRARLRRRVRVRRTGALLPGDQRRARQHRRERAGVRPVVDAAPQRDAGDHRARPRPDELRGHRAVPADGRRLRRQGDAAARLRRDRRARRPAHRATRPVAAQPHPGHDHDGQAARIPLVLEGRVRRRRTDPGTHRDADRGRRLEPRPVRARAGAGAVPHRQRLLDPEHRGARPDREDEQDVADRVPGLRRPPGHAGDREHPRPLRARARDQRPRTAPAQPLPSRTDHAVRAGRAPPRAAGAGLDAGRADRRRRPADRRDRGVQRDARAHQAGARDHPGEVRDLVQPDGVQPGGRAGARLQGRLGADQPWRHRDGPGPAHEDAAGGGDGARRAAVGGATCADPHRQGAQHVRHRGELGCRPQRWRGEERLRADQDPARGDRRDAAARAPRRRPVPRRHRHRAGRHGRADPVRGPGARGLLPAGAAVGGRLLPDGRTALGRQADARVAVQVLRVRDRGQRGGGRRVHRGVPAAPGRHRPRRRRQPLATDRPRAGRGRVRAGSGLADAGGPALGHQRPAVPRPAGHAGGQYVQAAELLGDARGLPGDADGAGHRGRRRLRIQGRRRAAADARVQRARGAARGGGGVRAARALRRPGLPVDAGAGVLGGRGGAGR